MINRRPTDRHEGPLPYMEIVQNGKFILNHCTIPTRISNLTLPGEKGGTWTPRCDGGGGPRPPRHCPVGVATGGAWQHRMSQAPRKSRITRVEPEIALLN